MRRLLRRLPLVVPLAVAGALLLPGHVSAACGTYSCVPMLAAVTPQQVVLDGKPVHLTLQGQNLGAVTAVIISPMAAPQGFTAFNDQTLLVTLPATVAPGIYSVRVISAEGGSDPTMAPQFQVFPAIPPATPVPSHIATPTPKPTPTPSPPVPESGVIGAVTGATPPPSPPAETMVAGAATTPVSAPVDIMVGLAAGALFFMLWGRPRRLSASWRAEPLRHLVGRPAQALHAGSICLYCGRLHFVFLTRRDLWRARKYCRPRCFISAEATPTPPDDHDEPAAAPWRAPQQHAST